MTEKETELIREYVQLKYLVEVAKDTLNDYTGLLKHIAKLAGSVTWKRLKVVEREMRALKVHAWTEDDGGEIIYVVTSVGGVKGRHGIKRTILLEDMQKRADVIAESLVEKEHPPYKVVGVGGDPYAKINKPPG